MIIEILITVNHVKTHFFVSSKTVHHANSGLGRRTPFPAPPLSPPFYSVPCRSNPSIPFSSSPPSLSRSHLLFHRDSFTISFIVFFGFSIGERVQHQAKRTNSRVFLAVRSHLEIRSRGYCVLRCSGSGLGQIPRSSRRLSVERLGFFDLLKYDVLAHDWFVHGIAGKLPSC